MRYQGRVIRPPSEADSYILQITCGCSHNACTFCGTYHDKQFRVRPQEEVLEDIAMAAQAYPDTRRVFLADGDALVVDTQPLGEILDALTAAFPLLRRVGIYAGGSSLMAKDRHELQTLREKGLQIVYLGLESGSEAVLRRVNKGCSAAEMVEGVGRAKDAGIKTSVIALLGIGGEDLSQQHAQETGKVVNEMAPDYLSMLTLMLVPGTVLHAQYESGEFRMLGTFELLNELRRMLTHLTGLSRCIFRTNHASNYVPLSGTLSRDRERLLARLDAALEAGESALRPEWMRGL